MFFALLLDEVKFFIAANKTKTILYIFLFLENIRPVPSTSFSIQFSILRKCVKTFFKNANAFLVIPSPQTVLHYHNTKHIKKDKELYKYVLRID